jgi:tetratricopeptide (TPR) repeat protein
MLTQQDIHWLEEQAFFAPLALYHEQSFAAHHNRWDAAVASKFWRKAGELQRALQIIESALKNSDLIHDPDQQEALAALLTSKAAVLREQGDLEKAERTVKNALEINPSSDFAKNLLWAIRAERGQRSYRRYELDLEMSREEESKNAKILGALDLLKDFNVECRAEIAALLTASVLRESRRLINRSRLEVYDADLLQALAFLEGLDFDERLAVADYLP